MRKFLSLILAVLLIASCTTFTSTEGPEWTRVTPRHAGMAVFVGSGVGRDDVAARAAAYRSVLEKLGSELGYDTVSPYYRELLSFNSIAALDAVITNTYSAPADAGITYFVMLEMPESVYLSSRDAEYSASIERTAEISSLLESALEHYRENEDTEALSDTLNALDLSLSGPVLNDDYSPERILGKAIGYLENIGIAIRDGRGTDVTLRMNRMRGLLHPRVVNGLIRVDYTMLGSDGRLLSASTVIRTGERGEAEFFRTNPYMLWQGSLRFSVYVSEEILESIASKAFEGFLDPIIELLDKTAVTYDYAEESRMYNDNTVTAVAEYSEDGTELGISPCFVSFSSYLEKAAAQGYLVVEGHGEEESDVLAFTRNAFPALDYYVILRAGIVDMTEGAGRVYAKAEARLSFYDEDGEEPYIIHELSVTGSGSTDSEAIEAALDRCGSAAAGMFLSEL